MYIRRAISIFILISALLLVTINAFAKEYHYEKKGPYIYHYFEFNEEETREMAKGPYKVRSYGDWMIEELETLSVKMGNSLEPLMSRAVLDFKLTALARYAEREGEKLKIKIRSRDTTSGRWGLDIYNRPKENWKELTR